MQDTGDVLYRVSGGVMVLSGLWNALMSGLLFLSLIMFCVGIFWLIPLLLSFCNIGIGIAMIVLGRKVPPFAFAPFLGMIASLCNMNFLGITLDLVAVGLGIGGFVTASNQRTLDDRGY